MSIHKLDLARNLLAAQFSQRERAVDDEIRAIVGAQAAKGSLLSGGTLRKLGRFAEMELRLRTDFALDVARRVSALETGATTVFFANVKDLIETNVVSAYKKIWEAIVQDPTVQRLQQTNPRGVETIEWEFSTVRIEQCQRVQAEIDLLAAEVGGNSAAVVRSEGQLKTAAIVAVDVVGYSAQAKADQEKALRDVFSVRATVDRLSTPLGGRMFKAMGDGFLLEFASCANAIEAAWQIALECKPAVRVGVHAGDVEQQLDGDLLGHNVNVADRIRAHAEPGSALVSVDARRMVRGPLLDRLVSRGEQPLAKMDETIELFELTAGKLN